MTGASNLIRTLVVYAIALPLALILGYAIATPLDYSSITLVGVILIALSVPLVLKWNRQILFLTWNMTAVIFFLPGRPQVWVAAAFVSFVVVVVQKTLIMRLRPIPSPSISSPLLFLLGAVLITAQLTGGIGLRAFGSNQVGGKAYVWMVAATLGYFAMKTYRIPEQKATIFFGMFFLGAITNAAGSSLNVVAPQLYYIFLVFPVDYLPTGDTVMILRYGGLTLAAMAVMHFCLGRYGLQGLLTRRRFPQFLLLLLSFIIVIGSGYRSHFLLSLMLLAAMFLLEGTFRSMKGKAILTACALACVLVIPFATKLPLSMQRTLSIFPIDVSPEARMDAESTSEWRIDMWKAVLPEIPKYFWLGKGIAIDNSELEFAQSARGQVGLNKFDAAIQTGAYHNGLLTVLIPFGIWGLLGWVWLLAASLKALYRNWKLSPPELKNINTLLFALFACKTLYYFTIFGEFRTDFAPFVGLIGLSLALNGGIREPQDPLSSSPQFPGSAVRGRIVAEKR